MSLLYANPWYIEMCCKETTLYVHGLMIKQKFNKDTFKNNIFIASRSNIVFIIYCNTFFILLIHVL